MNDNETTAPHAHTQRRTRRLVISSIVALGIALVAVLALVIPRGTTAQASDQPNSPFSAPTEDQLRDAEIRFQENLASGWMPMQDDHPYIGEPVTGWVPMYADASSLLAEYQKVEGRLPVFSQRGGGDLLGYMYQYIGYVPADVADSGTFDAHGIRMEKGGCDPIHPDGSVDQDCGARFHQ